METGGLYIRAEYRGAKIKNFPDPPDNHHGDSYICWEIIEKGIFKIGRHLGTAHRLQLKVIKVAIYSNKKHQNCAKIDVFWTKIGNRSRIRIC